MDSKKRKYWGEEWSEKPLSIFKDIFIYEFDTFFLHSGITLRLERCNYTSILVADQPCIASVVALH